MFQENGADWEIGGDANWTFDGEELVGKLDSGSGFVMTKGMFDNFEFTVEFNPDSVINSGIFVRCINRELSFSDCYEINIWDLHPNQSYRTGAIVSLQEPMVHVNTLEQWNTYRIRASGNTIEAWVNGEQTAKLTNDQIARGYIALQAAGSGEIRFRKAQLRPL